ncbi:MAG: hypothetical protein A2166_00375 [Omnitrophica WOR_2 bacterium RBG_13_41_10]|nr:MAG: hypothetical protein A2166_00375 [Omnitrophica WOR_2 bacterium RBG_13_41_10]
MRKMKVLYIIDKMNIGGTQKHLLEVLRLIDRNKYEPHLCCLVKVGDLSQELEKLGIKPKVYNIKRIYGYSGISSIISLAKYIKENRFDIVHTYLFLANIAGNLAARIAGTPVIISGRRDTGVPNEGKWYHNIAYRITHSFASRVICVSDAVADTVYKKEGVRKERILIIQNGIDLLRLSNGRLKREDLGLKEDDFLVNMTGSFSWVKNHQFLLDAAPEIIRRNPKIKFLLVGEGELKQSILTRVKNLHLESNIIFLGKRPDSIELLKISDIAINLSFSEGSSNVLLEAMALRKPVVATDIPGNRELIVDKVTGYFVPLGDKERLTEIIVALSKDKTEVQKIGERAIIHIEANFRIEDKIKDLEFLYSHLIHRDIFKKDRKIKALFLLTDALNVAGAQRNIISIAKYLLTQGHEVFIACRRGVLVQDIAQAGIKYIEYDFHFKGIKGFQNCAQALQEMIVRHNFDVIAPQSVRTAIVASSAVKHMSGPSKPVIIANIYNIGSKFYSLFAAPILNSTCDYVVFESNYERDRLIKRGLCVNKTSVLYTGIDLEKFIPAEKYSAYASSYGLDNGHIVVGTIARLFPEKDIATLIRSMAIIKRKTDKVKLLIAGDGILKQNLKYMARRLGLENQVIFAGTQQDTEKFISLFDIFVLPSVRESFSLATREAMAMGKPIIMTEIGGAKEMIEDGKSGILVPARNPKELAERIKQLIFNSELRQSMGNQARLRAELLFDNKKWLKQTEEIYLKFANENT